MDKAGTEKRKSVVLPGACTTSVNNLPEAIKAFTEAWNLSSEKDNDFFLLAIGDMRVQLKNWAAAETAYRLALQINNNSAHTWKKLADVLTTDKQRSSKKATAEALKKTLSFGEYVNDAELGGNTPACWMNWSGTKMSITPMSMYCAYNPVI